MNSSYLDTPAARKTLEHATRPFNIVSLLIMTLLSSALCLVGMFTGGLAWLHTGLPASTLALMLGIGFWVICCPQFLLLSSCRTLLRAIRELEKRVEELKHDA
jgi:hypothetical protein